MIGDRTGGTIAAGACATAVVLPVVLARSAIGTVLPFEIGGVAVIDDHLRSRLSGGRDESYGTQARGTQQMLHHAPLQPCRCRGLERGRFEWHDWLPSKTKGAIYVTRANWP